MRPPFSLGFRQWLTLAVGLFVVIPLILGITFQNVLYEAYLVHFEAPGLQRDLGFRADFVLAQNPDNRPYQRFTITAVEPGGPFSIAGIRPGDIPFGYKHGFRSGFYRDLSAARQTGSVALLIVRHPDSDPKAWETPIRVIVHLPSAKKSSAA